MNFTEEMQMAVILVKGCTHLLINKEMHMRRDGAIEVSGKKIDNVRIEGESEIWDDSYHTRR